MRVRFSKFAVALLATTAVGIGAAEISANLEARLQVRRLLAQHDGLAVGSVVAEPLSGRLFMHDIKGGHGAVRVTIGKLTLPLARLGFGVVTNAMASPFDDEPKATEPKPTEPQTAPGPVEKAMPSPGAAPPAATPPAPAPKAAAIPNTASADNVTITAGGSVYKIPHIDLTGTSLSNADVASLLDQTSPEPVASRLKKLNATSIVMPQVLVEDSKTGSEAHIAFQKVALSGVVAGRITAATIDGTLVALKNGDDSLNGTTGPIQAVGIDLPQIVRMATTVRTDDAEPVLPLYDSVTVNGMKFSNGKGGDFSLALMKETDLKGRPFKTDVFKKAQASGGDQSKLTEAEQAALYDDFLHSIEIGAVELTSITGHMSGLEGPQTVSLADFAMRGFAKGKVAGMSMHGFLVESEGNKVGLGGFEIGPFGLPPKKGAAVADATKAMLPAAIKLDLTKLDVDVQQKDKAAKHFVMTLAHAGLVSEGEAGEIPKSSKLTIDNVRFDLPPNENSRPLAEMGYGHLDLSAAMATTYDSATQELRFRDITFQGVNMGSLALGLQCVNVTKGIVSQNKEIAKSSLAAILVKGLSFKLVNEGLVDRVLAWKAKQDGATVEQEKAFVIDLVTNKLPASFNSANVKTIGAAIAKFIEKPKNLHIEIASKSGLGIGALSMLNDPALLIDTLDVKASANE